MIMRHSGHRLSVVFGNPGGIALFLVSMEPHPLVESAENHLNVM
jgi:hypothetical protein